MYKSVKNIFIVCLFTLVVAILCTCKKYPENNLWFKNPKKINPFCRRLKEYKVNGIDSLALLNNYFDTTIKEVNPKDISLASFVTNVYIKKESTALISPGVNNIGGIEYSLTKRNDFIKINFLNGMYNGKVLFKKNLFISSETEWKIIKLTKKTCDFKIETTLSNGNKYEISIGN